MGRCNNQRARLRAEENKNTAARARFSKGPPKKSGTGRGNSGGRQGRGDAADTTKRNVVQKITKRVEEKKVLGINSSLPISRRGHPLDGVDISKLDEITLSAKSVQLVTNLLRDLNVMESDNNRSINDRDEQHNDTSQAQNAEVYANDLSLAQHGCAEYEDDAECINEEIREASAGGEQRGEELPRVNADNEAIRNSTHYQHLTLKLSFSDEHALRACRGIKSWNVSSDEDVSNNSGELALAMDWLCLHLSDEELKQGFKVNQTNVSKRSSTGLLLVGSGRTRAVPHPSISVAKPLGSDIEWKESVRRDARTVGFIRLGFSSLECEHACNHSPDIEAKYAEDDEAALRIMLRLLEIEAVGDVRPAPMEHTTAADLAFSNDEQDQEVHALRAIYDESFRTRESIHPKGRFMIKITLIEKLRSPGDSNSCWMHVFSREGYPILDSALLLFTNPSLPPSLLRRINCHLAKKASRLIGEPAIFSLIDYLSNNMHVWQLDFIKEQRAKEMEAVQLTMRDEAGHDVSNIFDEKIGRRQKARLKGAEKAFDRPDQLREEYEARRRQEEKRLARIVADNEAFLPTMAQREIEKRNRNRIEDEAENAARFAMNKAFNEGKSAQEARRLSYEARKLSLIRNGVEKPLHGVANEPASVVDSASNLFTVNTTSVIDEFEKYNVASEIEKPVPVNIADKKIITATSMAFMERLRDYYAQAATLKQQQVCDRTSTSSSTTEEGLSTNMQILLSDPSARPSDLNDKNDVHIPAPVPIPTGDLGKVMKDVLELQRDQPWLIAGEARAPYTSILDAALTCSQIRLRNETSKKLRADLEQKYSAADQVDKQKQGGAFPHSKTGIIPERFHLMLRQRRQLPTYKMKDDIIKTVERNQICVISGDTGCGKTTQVPQIILDDLIWKNRGAEANMIVTQPRRISAIGVSERVAAERCEKVGETAGYSIRLENKRSNKTRILLCTTGILLRRLQCDPDLASVSHIFVDEVHERDLNTDFLLIILKELLARRKSLKLVLMSATLNAHAFSSYFGNCPVVSIPGRTHPVTEYRLEDILMLTGYEVPPGSDYVVKTSTNHPPQFSKSRLRQLYYPKYPSSVIESLAIVDETVINYELLALLLERITMGEDDGAILVFMPGLAEITKAIEELSKKPIFQSCKVVIYPLHSALSTVEQTSVFDIPPVGVRKIVVSTNIAETSITIEDIVFVVDCGRVKENRKDELNEMPTLVETWVSRASAKQRRGRAGRVRPGVSYHLYSSHTFQHCMEEYQLPEMLRVGLEDLVLQILVLDLGEPSVFLTKAVNPPSALALKNSLKLLEGLGAIEVQWNSEDSLKRDDNESCAGIAACSGLTALGFHLATLPVDPHVGKIMIFGALFGCTDPALTIAASMSARSPFISPIDKRNEADEARQAFATEGSDHLTTLSAFNQWKEMSKTKGDRATSLFLRESFLSRQTLIQMDDLRKQFANLLVEIGFLPKGFRLHSHRNQGSGDQTWHFTNANSKNLALIKTILCAGLYPNIIVAPRNLVDSRSLEKSAGECAFRSLKGDVYLHPCTISFKSKRLDSRYCCYQEIMKTSKIYVRDCTTVNPLALLLFGGSLQVFHSKHVVTVDQWLQFTIRAKPATLVKHLRAQMESLLLRKILSPEDDVTGSKEGQALIQAVSMLLATETPSALPDGSDIVRPWYGNMETGRTSGRTSGRGGRSGRGRGDYLVRGRRNGRGHGNR